MDFKEMLTQLSQLSEAETRKIAGKAYGGSAQADDEDDDGEENKNKKPEVKRGRGRPPKTGEHSQSPEEIKKKKSREEAGKALQSMIVGNVPKKSKELEKLPKKKHSLKEWVEEVESKYFVKEISEAAPGQALQVKPMQGAAQLVDPATQRVLATGAADKIKAMQGSIAKGEVAMTPMQREGMAEEGEKWIQKAIDPTKKGALRTKLGAKPGEPIPAGKLEKATHSKDPTTARQARLAQTLRGLKKEGVAEGFGTDPTQQGTWHGHKIIANRKTPKGSFLIIQNKNDGKYEIHKHNPGVVGGLEFVSVHKTPEEMQAAFRQLTGVDESQQGVAEGSLEEVSLDLAKRARDKAEYFVDMDYDDMRDRPYGHSEKQRSKFQRYIDRKEPRAKGDRDWDPPKQGVAEGDIPSDQVDMGAGLGAGRSQTRLETKQVHESMNHRLNAARHAGKAHALAKEGYNCRYEDVEEAKCYHEGYKEGLDECYGQVPIRGTVVDEMDIPATVSGMADQAEGLDEMDMYEMDKTEYMKHKARTTPGSTFKAFGQTMQDKDVLETSMFESWNNELNSLLTEYDTIQEGMTVSISKGQQGMPDSVSITAQDTEAEELLGLIKSAGLGLFKDEGHQPNGMSIDMQHGDKEDIDVVGDHDGMMALIKKVTGDAGKPNSVAIGQDDVDYEEEEEVCDDCGHSDCQCDHEEHEKVDEVESEDQMAYEVAEDNAPDSGAEDTAVEVADTAQANQSAAETEKLDEWANEAGQDGTEQAFETDIEFMTKVIAGGLNKEKATGQTTIPVITGQNDRMGYSVQESISDWKKLAGLK